ncbi:MATE family efflux transporter [Vallitalea pronyensis]|uniref:Probable multidrug resistance protein NorM n=1 Tax=Vallitalea pronyensis TaxID=1348613 RepID=A0A8J8MKF1_9FIRM|nr:MATE family efflux transporter [Vallitalea pronyensis]QUI23119.1 MATE family efflux transporter [Vallitalea pronyensis]
MKNFIKIDTLMVREINQMAIPMLFNSVIGMLIGLIDMAMIGRISLEAFGAVGLISSTINSITGVLGAISIAFNIAGARCKGQGNPCGLRDIFLTGSYLAWIIGLAFWVVCLYFGTPLLQYGYGLKGNILKESVNYLHVFSLSVGLNMLLFMHSALFKILNKTRYLFIGNITATITNVILNYILIFGKFGIEPMGVKGAGIGSVIALTLNLIIYVMIVQRHQFVSYGILSIKKFVAVGRVLINDSFPLMGQEVLESTILVVCINAILSRIGVLEVSIYTFLLGMMNILLMPMYAYASTSLTFVSEHRGKRDYSKIMHIPRCALRLALRWCLSLGIGIWIFKYPLAHGLTNDTDLITHGINYLLMAIITYICTIPNTIYKYSLQGIGQEKWVFLNGMVINILGILLIYTLSNLINWGMLGVYMGLCVTYIVLSVRHYRRYHHSMMAFKY